MLVILDVHQDWCGPCEAIHPTLLRVFAVRLCSNGQCHSYLIFTSHQSNFTDQDYDDSDERCVVASASIKKLGEALIQSTFPVEAHMNLEKNGEYAFFRVPSNATYLVLSIIHSFIHAISTLYHSFMLTSRPSS